ncbi:GNAT family N-acetyltransferase [Actinacidiphila sp. bgisy160]|uniref:GNAT family N-acetyltransferase n=1 Tax=Actinacidiphila sp. bgisy160 TaxID=3413796 RepID=UPI003D70B959
MDLELRRVGREGLDEVRQTLLDVFAEVYAHRMSDPFFSVERFDERLTGHAGRNSWEAVIGYDNGTPVGYAYGAALQPGARWWMHQLDPLPEDYTEETGARTLALFELMTREQWRGQGIARRIHEELLAGRAEERVTLLVDPRKTEVKATYERWGYTNVGEQKPFPDSPLYATMVRQLRAPTAA